MKGKGYETDCEAYEIPIVVEVHSFHQIDCVSTITAIRLPIPDGAKATVSKDGKWLDITSLITREKKQEAAIDEINAGLAKAYASFFESESEN